MPDVVAGRFEILREAGSGGMAVVYEAVDRTTGERVALKVLADRAHAARFTREAHVLAELEHDAIVRYVAHGVDGERAFLAMEWLDGEDLGARLARGPLAIEETLALAARVAEGVAFAHARGVVHRDLKPTNVFVAGGRVDRAKLLDFGLARDPTGRNPLTMAGAVMGSIGYLSPEQARGTTDVDARSDVFSLGCIVFECLTGKAAFSGEHAVAVVAKLLIEDAPRVRAHRPEVPRALDELVAQMLERNPERRPRDARAVCDALAAIVPGGSSPSLLPLSSMRPSALGREEQRVMAVILVGERPVEDTRDASSASSAALTTISLRGDDARAAIDATAKPFGAGVDAAGTGTVIVTLRGGASVSDQALRAAQCALALRAACPGAAIALAVGRGVADGSSASGAVIERAAALLERAVAASADAVHVEASVVPLLEPRFVLTDDAGGPLLRAERSALESSRVVRGRPTPFVGRSRELAAIENAFTTAMLEREASAVVVVGPAGSGKSRLREEVVRAVQRREASAQVWIAQGDPLRAKSPLAPLAHLLRGLAGADDAQDAVARERLVARLDDVPESAREHALVFLAEMIGAPLDAAASAQLRAARDTSRLMQDQITRAWTTFVAAEVARAPIVLVLEDVHWFDAASLALVDATLAAARDAPVLVLALGRPDGQVALSELWTQHGAQLVNLAPLAPKAAEKLAREVLAGLDVDEASVARLLARAAGSPFVIEELARAWARDGGDAVPDGVLALVQARLEMLDPALRRAMRAASIFGRVAREDGVARLLGDDDAIEAVRAAIRSLVAREVLETSTHDPRIVRFRHDLVRDAAYAMLTDADRAVGHALAGAWLESQGEIDAAVLARHFDLGGERERAAAWHVRAAEQALEGSDDDVVAAHVGRALELGAAGELRGRALHARALAKRWRGDPSGFEDARDALATLTAGSALWFASMFQAMCIGEASGRRDEVAGLVALALATEPLDARAKALRVRALGEGATARYHAGDHAGGARLAERVEQEAAAMLDDPAVALTVRHLRGMSAAYRSDYAEELATWLAMGELYEAMGDHRGATAALSNVGYAWMMLGAWDRAEDALRRAIATAAALRLRRAEAAARHNLGMVLAYRGEHAAGEREELAALQVLASGSDDRLAGASRVYLAMILEMAGDFERAEAIARDAVATLGALPPLRSRALAVLARVVLRRGRAVEAERISDEAMRVLEVAGVEGGARYVHLVRIEALLAVGRRDEADALLRAAKRGIDEAAARIADPELRALFLSSPDNARIVDLSRSP